MEVINSVNSVSFDPSHILNCATTNVFLSVILGKRYGYNDPELLGLIRLAEENLACGTYAHMIASLKLLRFITPFSRAYKVLRDTDQKCLIWRYICALNLFYIHIKTNFRTWFCARKIIIFRGMYTYHVLCQQKVIHHWHTCRPIRSFVTNWNKSKNKKKTWPRLSRAQINNLLIFTR